MNPPLNSSSRPQASSRPQPLRSQPSRPQVNRAQVARPAEQVEAERKRRQKRRERQDRRKRALVLTLLIALSLVLSGVVISILISRNKSQPRLQFVKEGQLYQLVDSKCLVIRSESVVRGEQKETAGVVYPLAAEASQVGYGQKVALLADSEVDSLQEQLQNYERQIAERQIELVSQGKGEGAKLYYLQAEEQFRDSVRELALAASVGNLQVAARENLRLSNALEQRKVALGRIVFDDPVLKELQEKAVEFQDQLALQSELFLSPVSGLVSYSYDGLEEELKYDKISELSADRLAQIFSQSIESRNTQGLQATANAPVYRVVNGFYQYFVLDINTSGLEKLGEEASLSLYFPDEGVEINNCPILYKLNHGQGAYLFVRSEKAVARLLRSRRVNVQIRLGSRRGLVLPLAAFVEDSYQNGKATVVTLQSGMAKYVEVEVLLANADEAVVRPVTEEELEVGSLYVENPSGLKEGDRLE